jgi:hypothetical protein
MGMRTVYYIDVFDESAQHIDRIEFDYMKEAIEFWEKPGLFGYSSACVAEFTCSSDSTWYFAKGTNRAWSFMGRRTL